MLQHQVPPYHSLSLLPQTHEEVPKNQPTTCRPSPPVPRVHHGVAQGTQHSLQGQAEGATGIPGDMKCTHEQVIWTQQPEAPRTVC